MAQPARQATAFRNSPAQSRTPEPPEASMKAGRDGCKDHPNRAQELSPSVCRSYSPSGFSHGADKTGLIRLVLPDARIIHCRRDAVDTCLSCYTKLFAGEQAFAYNQTELGRFHCAYQALMAHWRATLPASHFLEVDYEAVVDDLEREARRMLDFLRLPWSETVLRFHETERPVRTASVNQVRQPIYRSSAGRWRKHAADLQPLLTTLGVRPA
jgi:Sulfotransferase family